MDSIVMIGRYQRWVQAISPAPQAAKSLQEEIHAPPLLHLLSPTNKSHLTGANFILVAKFGRGLGYEGKAFPRAYSIRRYPFEREVFRNALQATGQRRHKL